MMELNANNTPVIYEADFMMGDQYVPNGHVVYRYVDGRNYMGTMQNGIPHGFGILTGFYWVYEGQWNRGMLVCGVMKNIRSGERIIIPSVHRYLGRPEEEPSG